MLKTTLTLTLLLLVSGCVSAVNDSALCAAVGPALTDHAAALASDGGPASVQTGDRLVRMIDAGCG